MLTRRSLLAGTSAATLLACQNAKSPSGGSGEEDISPTEDLMREHGLLARVLVVYDEAIARLDAAQPWPVSAVARGADVVRRFVEDYHEKQEEDDVFPRLEKAGKLADVTAVLRQQHKVGRALTDTIRRLANEAVLADPAGKKQLREALAQFNRMYRAHASHEDTIVFPAYRELLSEKELHAIGEAFEAREHKVLGPRGFEGVRDEVLAIEVSLGIADLARFTPAS